MKLQINSKKYALKGYLKDEIEQSLSKLEKFFSDDTSVSVTITGQKTDKKVDITVGVKNNVLRSEVADKDVRIAIDKAIEKIEKQLIKHKDKLKKRNNDSIRYDNIKADNSEDTYNIVRNKAFVLTPMTPSEACFQLELLEHEFYVFQNIENNKICVVYKRKDTDYGMIEPEYTKK